MDQDTSDVRDAIVRDREDLAETVEALAHKMDVKERVRENVSTKVSQLEEKASDVKAQLQRATPEQAQAQAKAAAHAVQERPVPFAVGGAFLVGLVLGRMMGRRRS